MWPAQDIAAVKVAIEICNNPELKREVLCAFGSDYYINKGRNQFENKKQWDEAVKKKAAIILRNLGLPERLHEKVMVFVLLVGMRMLTWAEYHEGTFGFPREYIIDFFSVSFFTSRGIVDNKKAAEKLMNDKNLSIKQKYKLACIYCFIDRIPSLYRQMSKEDEEEFYDAQNPGRINQPELVKFWTYQMSEIVKLQGDSILDLHMFELAIHSGSKMAVQYCFEKRNLRKKDAFVDATVKAVRNWTMERDNWIAFRDYRYDDSKERWTPIDYYVDIFCFLLSKMTEEQRMDFFKRGTGILQCFLNWPYQDYFMNTAKLIWEFLKETYYAALLLKICDKIEARDETLKNGEEKSYDYRGLLKEFWCQSPERYKRYIFSNQKGNNRIDKAKAGVELLIKLLTLKNFAKEDKENVKLIFASATDKEKECITSSEVWRRSCIRLIEEEKWKILDRFVLNCFSSDEEADRFKWELSFTTEVQRICIDFVKNDKLNAAELFIRWSAASEKEINKLKKEMIFSEYGKWACIGLICNGEDMKYADKFIEWFVSSEEFRKFKKDLIDFNILAEYCLNLVLKDRIERADEFTKWFHSSEEEIKKLKKNVAYINGYSVCKRLISKYYLKIIRDEGGYSIGTRITFEGGKWEQVEKFLTWCFSSEAEMNEFKTKLLKETGAKIHYNLIACNQWDEAETFFAWLGLSAEETQELKKNTLFNHDEASKMFCELMYSEEGDERFIDYGSKQEAIELLLRWYLTDKETVLTFKNEFKSQFPGEVTENRKAMFDKFDLMIEQRLKDLDEKQR